MSSHLLSVGYRPFFLLAGVNAWGTMSAWLIALAGGRPPTQVWPPPTYHAHEMIFGTVVAVIAGFLLTAVPNWTGTARVAGGRLAGLALLHAAGRLVLLFSGSIGPVQAALVDVAFLPCLAILIALPILRTRNWRNLPVVAVVLGMAAANVAVHRGLALADYRLLRVGTHGAVYLVVILMLIIAGRVVPNFTRNALMRSGIEVRVRNRPRWGPLAVGVACLALVADLAWPDSRVGGVLALLAAPLLVVRQSGWQFPDTLRYPMLWVLHVGHFWLAIGFACIGISTLWAVGIGAAALHALTAGAMGTLMLGMMTRVSLGHSGRPIEAGSGTVWIFALVILGATIRILGAWGWEAAAIYQPSVLIGGALWTAAWVLFSLLYTRILIAPAASKA